MQRFNLRNELEEQDKIMDNIRRSARMRGSNLWILMFAIFIASIGLNVNSTAVIIGAMLISPLMGPIMGIGLGAGINDVPFVRYSFISLLSSVGVSLATSTLYFLLSPISDAHSEILARTTPTIWDVLIALFGGFAAIFANSTKEKGNVIPGAAIATALMPPLCTAGFGLAHFDWPVFFGAFYLFLINSVFISLATLLTVRFLRFPTHQFSNPKTEKLTQRLITVIVLITLLPSTYLAYQLVQRNRFTTNAERFVNTEGAVDGNYLLDRKIDPIGRTISLTYGGEGISDDTRKSLQTKLEGYGIAKAKLTIEEGLSFKSFSNSLTNRLNTENNEKKKYLSAIDDLQKEKEKLQTKLDSIHQQQTGYGDLYKEAKAINPQLVELSISPIYGDSSSVSQLVYMRFTKLPDKKAHTQLESWLKVKMGDKPFSLVVGK